MVIRINKVYTRIGDGGVTCLVGGQKASKSCLQVSCYGEIDELNAAIGVAIQFIPDECSKVAPLLLSIQNDLFDIGSELATPLGGVVSGSPQVDQQSVKNLELLCDKYGEGMPELTSFILPGGSKFSAFLHLARTVCRRAERSIVAFWREAEIEGVSDGFNRQILIYVNRLSDLLFILSRWALREEGRPEVLWDYPKP